MKIAWCITGAGHFLEESYEVFRTIKRGVRCQVSGVRDLVPETLNLKPKTSHLS